MRGILWNKRRLRSLLTAESAARLRSCITRFPGVHGFALVLFAAVSLDALQPARAQHAERMEIWDIPLGSGIAGLSARDFQLIACGTDGGPPSKPLDGFADYVACSHEPTGLREVYLAYDDEMEYIARANRNLEVANRLSGTRVFGFAAIISLLVDDEGIVQGIRIVTDPRAATRERANAVAAGRFVKARFRMDGWSCIDKPRQERFEPAQDQYIDQSCEKIEPQNNRRLLLTMHHFRKPGQFAFDPITGERLPGDLESSTRLEILALNISPRK